MSKHRIAFALACGALASCGSEDVQTCPGDLRSTVLACNLRLPDALAVAEGVLFVKSEDALLRVDPEEQSTETVSNTSNTSFGVFDGMVYWWQGAELSWVSPDEKIADRHIHRPNAGAFTSFVSGFPRVSWVAEGSGEVVALSDDLSSSQVIVSGLRGPTAAVVSGQDLVVVESSTVAGAGRVLQFPINGGVPVAAATLEGTIGPVVGRSEGTYLASTTCAGFRCKSWIGVLAGGVGRVQVLAHDIPSAVGGLLVTDTHLYWSQRDAVRRCNKDGMECITVIDGLKTAGRLAFENHFVYVVERGIEGDTAEVIGRVHKIAEF